VEQILAMVCTKGIEWLSSEVLKIEVVNNPNVQRRDEVEVLLSLATERCLSVMS
jgi:hypothetical protein